MFNATSHNINHGKDKKKKSIDSEMAKKNDGKKAKSNFFCDDILIDFPFISPFRNSQMWDSQEVSSHEILAN